MMSLLHQESLGEKGLVKDEILFTETKEIRFQHLLNDL
jgi:hypothetical protein